MITKVLYERINPALYSEYDAGLNYFYINALGINESIQKEFSEYEEKQLKMRNSVIGSAKNEFNVHPKVQSSLIGLSSLCDNAILMADL